MWHTLSLPPLWVVFTVAAGWCALAAAAVAAAMALVVRSWDGDVKRAHQLPLSVPFPIFWVVSWVYGVAESIAAMKPAPMRIAELSTNYISSQVLFNIVSLGVPDALLDGPKTAAEVAAGIGPTTQVDWLDRLMSAAAALGILTRIRQAAVVSVPHKKSMQHTNTSGAAQQVSGGRVVYAYSLNAVSAALTSKSPVNMSHLVASCEDDYVPFASLSEGIRSGSIPYKLHTGGQGYWEWSSADPTGARGTRFDLAMVAVNHYGGTAVVNTYPWAQFDSVVDVAGGVGGFMAALLQQVPGLKQGVVFDLPTNIKRAEQIWAREHSALLPRVQLVPGDMFDASTIPPPPAGSSSTAYVLRNILHDWPDAECISVLRAIRRSVDKAAGGKHAANSSSSSSSSSSVKLLIVEVTTADEVLPCHLPHRHMSDMVMLVLFGDGKERNLQQFRALFEASGWRLTGMKPTSGVFMVIEAEPM